MDRINADLLRTFVEVAKVEHLGRAAEALQADQSTVSRKIARLEEEVGVQLFERIGRNIRLTQAGRRFVSRAERLLDDLRDAIADAEGAVAAESGRVCVAFLHTLEEGTTAEVMSGVLGGDYDLGILGPPPTGVVDLEIHPLFRERVAVVVPVNHRLVGRSSVTLEDVAGEPLILPRSRSGLRRVIDAAFAAQGLTTHVAYEGDDFTIVQGLVEAGLGTTLMPMPLPVPSTRVAVIPLRDPPIARTMALCWDRRRTLPPAANLFAQRLIAEASEPFDLAASA
jgi:LysR family transcriptional regulator, transcription activator of glutamate synthase operon